MVSAEASGGLTPRTRPGRSRDDWASVKREGSRRFGASGFLVHFHPFESGERKRLRGAPSIASSRDSTVEVGIRARPDK